LIAVCALAGPSLAASASGERRNTGAVHRSQRQRGTIRGVRVALASVPKA
jgi:hypothetical protein